MTSHSTLASSPRVAACWSLLALLPLLLTPVSASADIYRFVDRSGVVHFADRPLGPGYKLYLRTPKSSSGSTTAEGWEAPRLRPRPENRERYAHLVDAAALSVGLNQALIDAVITAESAYDPQAVSHKGAVGLMQLMPGTAQRYGVEDRKDPFQNIMGGSRYLRDLLERFENLTLAVAAYNAGEGAVEKYGKQIPPYPETQQYVQKVLTLFRRNLQEQ